MASQLCWRKDKCKNNNCRFIHPRAKKSQIKCSLDDENVSSNEPESNASLQERLFENDCSNNSLQTVNVQGNSDKNVTTDKLPQIQPFLNKQNLKEDIEKETAHLQANLPKKCRSDSKSENPTKEFSYSRPQSSTSYHEQPTKDGNLDIPLRKKRTWRRSNKVTNQVNKPSQIEAESQKVSHNDVQHTSALPNMKDDPSKHVLNKSIPCGNVKASRRPAQENKTGLEHIRQQAKNSQKKCHFGSKNETVSCEFSPSYDSRNSDSNRKHSLEVGGSDKSSQKLNTTERSKLNFVTNHISTQIQPEWQQQEFDVIQQHRNVITNIKDEISKLTLSEDYGINFERQEANIKILRENIIELESQIFIFDSLKSRAFRELSTKPTELSNQICREIYRLKSRLGAFAKRLDIEKYFTSGHRFLIVQGQTGSGKSTQIPQYVADHPRFYGKRIICTQPRKLAAISLSRRVSFEYSGGIIRDDASSYIGYQVGGDKRDNKHCRLEFVTEGIMLERIMNGDMNSFKNVGCVIVDEAHERSITCDLLLGSFKQPDPRWKDILIIATSATIDLNLFSEFFLGAPTVQIEGRTFPVDIIYQPVTNEFDIQNAVVQCALQIHRNCKSASGDILCFLPGLEDVLNAKLIFERNLKTVNRSNDLLDAVVFSLYGKQDPEKQAEVFVKIDQSRKRKIIFATDVAETSITIEGVVYVVDSGVKKEIVFDAQRNISSLKLNTISKSSAIQRAGRSGRTQPGICYRLYSQDEFESMNINAPPEVLCKPISLAVLTLLRMSIDPIDFDWISAPSKEAMVNAGKELIVLGAVDTNKKPTEFGTLIASCQQDPKMMKIVYCGCLQGFGEAACGIAAILTVSNMFFWKANDPESKAKAVKQRTELALPEGDIVTMYRAFEDWNTIYQGQKMLKDSEGTEKHQTSNPKKQASVWCIDNFVNQKALLMAMTTKAELMKQLKKTKIWTKFGCQNKLPSNLDVQELMCSGYFPQSARVFYSKRANAAVEYFSVESEVAGRLDFHSTLKLLDIEPPKWIVYDKIVRLPNTIFPIASVMDESWLRETNPDFYKMCLQKTETLPTDLIMKSISQVSFRMIFGKNFSNVDTLEKELGCLVTGDADAGLMRLYCASPQKMIIEQLIESKIDDAITAIKKQVVEEMYIGETRVVIGEGYQVQEILFENEFATLYIKNLSKNFEKEALKKLLTMNSENLASLDCTDHGAKYTAVAKFSSKKDAKSAQQRLDIFKSEEMPVTVTPSLGGSKGVRHAITCRLKLTWPTAASTGTANVFFHTPESANNFLENVHFICPRAVVHVCGETKRVAQLRQLGERPNIVQPPLTTLKLNKQTRGCRFRFDIVAIRNIPNKTKLNYKIILRDLDRSMDRMDLVALFQNYGPKNIILEYTDVVTPKAGNGLTIDEQNAKLKPLSRFMKSDTKTNEFFIKKSGVAGICIFFTSNSSAKEAYNYAKPQYDEWRCDSSLQRHRLEIEFTHMVSIQADLYTFLKPQITALHKEAVDKGVNSITAPIRDNSKFVIMRFHTNTHSLLNWIQEKLDELIKPTKFNCPNSEVLFTWTGRQELMKLAKRNYIHWKDDSQMIWVYGSLDHKQNVCKEIEKIAAHLKSLDILDQEIWVNKTVKINGKEGRTIVSKCRETKLDYYHFYGNKIYVSGSKKSVDIVVHFMEKSGFIWNRSTRNQFKYEECRECGLCGMPPDNTFIMLSVCGHLFCSDCIEPMVNMQPPPFPIICPFCEQFVALHDIKKLGPAKSLERVLELAVRKFQNEHSHDIRLCPNPGCTQLLSYDQRTTGTHGGDFLFCDECITTFCITCSDKMSKPIKSHEDESCENIQSGKSFLAHKHVLKIQETILNLSCPKCKTAFFEFDGCAAVVCSSCKAGFCGLCLQHCGIDAHSHVLSCPKNPVGSYYVNERDLNAVHLEMRNQKLREYMRQHVMDPKLQRLIVLAIKKDLLDLGMDVPEMSTDMDVPEVSTDMDGSNEVSEDVLRHVRTLQDNILTLKCPYCSSAFFDFDGCAAVTCGSCQTQFCGICLCYCGNNVLAHVTNCDKNPTQGNYFVSTGELSKIHAALRSEKIQAYFDKNISDVRTREKVISVIRRDLTDLQIELPVITPCRRNPAPAAVRRPAPPLPPPRRFEYDQPFNDRRQLFAHAYLLQPEEVPIRRNPAPEVVRQPAPPRRFEYEPFDDRRQIFAHAYRLQPEEVPIRRPAPRPKRDCCIL